MADTDFIPKHGEKAVIVGQNGSGKSVFATWLLQKIETTPFVIYDTKGENEFLKLPGSVLVESFEAVADEIDKGETDYIVFRPPVAEIADHSVLDDYLYQHYERFSETGAYIDEIYSFHNNGRAGIGLTALLTRGRSRGQTTIMSTQRPVWLSTFALSESRKFYVFDLIHNDDKKKMGKIIPDFENAPALEPFAFIFYKTGDKTYRISKPIPMDNSTPPPMIADNEPREAISRFVWI